MKRWVAATLLCVWATACRDDKLQSGEGQVRLSPPVLELGEVYAGETATGWLEVQNGGASALSLSWATEGDGFSLELPPETLPGGAVLPVQVHAATTAPGPLRGAVTVSGPNNLVRVEVTGEAVNHPPCVPSRPCVVSTWSETERACVETPEADGTSCSDVCLDNAHCVAGRCVGDEKSCDDGDACTTDLCMSELGCTHAPAPPCPGDGRCQQGVCDPKRGCGLEAAPDGTSCGRTGCQVADVCIAGACVERDPPDGFVCAQASPCQDEGRCQQDVCVRPPPVALAPAWELGGPLEDGGKPDPLYSDLMFSPTDALALSGYFSGAPRLDARGAAPVDLVSPARRCIFWQNVLACADFPGNVAAGVSAVDAATGAVKWSYGSVLIDLPNLVGANKNTFLARLAVLSPTRLAALFETRTVNGDGSDGLCRTFSVVVLDRYGAKVDAWSISDPMFLTCNHPHSYGVASDAQGNLYLAFTPSINSNPAEAASGPTLLVSYSPIGQLRWKGQVPMLPGGELAVANGVLFHQHAVTGFSTADGTVVGVLPGEFHNGVATQSVAIPGPLPGTLTLSGYAFGGLGPTWSYALPPGQAFSSDVVRLATWTTKNGAAQVVLGFARTGGDVALVAVDAATGQEAFQCPLAAPLDPLLVEVATDGLAVMAAYDPPQTCSICDPRYAGTRNRFSWYPLPHVGRASAPWPGTYGGPGHDHHED